MGRGAGWGTRGHHPRGVEGLGAFIRIIALNAYQVGFETAACGKWTTHNTSTQAENQ